MTSEETNQFFQDSLNYAVQQILSDDSLPTTAVIMNTSGKRSGCALPFTDAKSRTASIAEFVDELKSIKPKCAIVVVPISTSAGRGKKRKTSLCVAFQSATTKFVSMVDYSKSKSGEFTFEPPYFCDDNEIILNGHEYFGDAFQ